MPACRSIEFIPPGFGLDRFKRSRIEVNASPLDMLNPRADAAVSGYLLRRGLKIDRLKRISTLGVRLRRAVAQMEGPKNKSTQEKWDLLKHSSHDGRACQAERIVE